MKTEKEAINWIHSRLKFGSRPGLERIEALLEKLGNPQNKLKTIHIAGTNGKGSTVTFLRCLLESQGLTVGTFTSPYIVSFNERISINNNSIPPEDLIQLVNKIYPYVEELDETKGLEGITEFEIITALMFDYFYQKKVDIAIVEVGLGGTFDCTNVINPLISAIVTVGYDHMNILGDNLTEIATQKAGIIKAEQPVVVGKVTDSVFQVIAEKACQENSQVFRYGHDFISQNRQLTSKWKEIFTFKNANYTFKDLKIPLIGSHQIENAAVAIELFLHCVTNLQLSFQLKDIQQGIAQADWPGRMEKLSESPLIILDGAHNEPAIERLVKNVKEKFTGSEIYILFSALNTKDISKMLYLFKKISSFHLIVTSFDAPNAMSGKEIANQYDGHITVYENWQLAIRDIMLKMDQQDILLVTGSLYFISEVRHLFIEDN